MNVALHHTVDGPEDAPLLVLGPSLGTTVEIWQPQIDALSARYRVVRYDHRGHGGSPTPPGPYGLADLGGDILSLLDTLPGAGGQRVHLGGLSLGGLLAAWVAARIPQRVASLTLVGTSPRFGTPEMWRQRAATVETEGVAAIADAALERWFPPGFAQRHAGVVAWTRRQLVNTPAAGYAGCCAALAEADLTPLLPAITAPALIIAGTDDPASPPAHAHELAAGIPTARVEVVPDAAHLVNVAAPETVTRLLLSFLEDNPL